MMTRPACDRTLAVGWRLEVIFHFATAVVAVVRFAVHCPECGKQLRPLWPLPHTELGQTDILPALDIFDGGTMFEHLASQKKGNASRWTAISNGVGHLLTSLGRGLTKSHQTIVTAFDTLLSAVRFTRSMQRVAGLVDDASLPRTGDPQDWLECSLAEDEAAWRSARAQQRLMDGRRLKSVDFAAKDVAMRRAGGEVDFPG
jgi:hypothetical protein